MRREPGLFGMIAALAALAGCAGNAVASAPAPVAVGESITFDLASWGLPIIHWQVNADGSGEVWRVANQTGPYTYDLQKFRLRMTEEAMLALVAATEPVREAARKGIACDLEMSDAPYGRIVWTFPAAQQDYAFNFGCGSAEAKAANQALGRANEAVGKLAIIDSEPFATQRVGEN